MKIILTGATGAAGIGILRSAIADSSITKITVLSRRPLPKHIPTEKVTRIEHLDFNIYPPELLERLEGHGSCIWALGKSSVGMSEEEYTRITCEYPVAALNAFSGAGIHGENGSFSFIYISGMGVNTEGKGALFARVKGRAEKDLAAFAEQLPSLRVFNLRPSYFFPTDAQDKAATRSLPFRIVDRIARPLIRSLVPHMYIDTEDMGRFALEAGKGRIEPGTYSNSQMLELTSQWKNERTADGNGNIE